MNVAALILLTLVLSVTLILLAWRWTDNRADAVVWAQIAAKQPSDPARFDPSMVAGLPDPAQRFLLFAIKPGTPLYTVAEIHMEGKFSPGSQEKPGYLPIRAMQILTAPHGFVWRINAGKGVFRLSGSDVASDGSSWSRFWLLGIAPVARAGGNADHLRSAFGRYVAEAVFWAPAALLTDKKTRWDSINKSTVRVTMAHRGMEQAVDLSIDDDGRPCKIVFQRWSDANAGKTYQLQPFGGYLSNFKIFDGFNLPTQIEAGNCFETDDYFPFYQVSVTSIRFPVPKDD